MFFEIEKSGVSAQAKERLPLLTESSAAVLSASEVVLISHPFFHRYGGAGVPVGVNLRAEQARLLGTIQALEVVAELRVEWALCAAVRQEIPLVVTLPQRVIDHPEHWLGNACALLTSTAPMLAVPTPNYSGILATQEQQIFQGADWATVYAGGGYIAACLEETARALPKKAEVVFLRGALIADISGEFMIQDPKESAAIATQLAALDAIAPAERQMELLQICDRILRRLPVYEQAFVDEQFSIASARLRAGAVRSILEI